MAHPPSNNVVGSIVFNDSLADDNNAKINVYPNNRDPAAWQAIEELREEIKLLQDFIIETDLADQYQEYMMYKKMEDN